MAPLLSCPLDAGRLAGGGLVVTPLPMFASDLRPANDPGPPNSFGG